MNIHSVKNASILWHKQDGLVSSDFNDIYFSKQSGIAETEYVFLAGNTLPTRLIQFGGTSFIVVETGFGTGLNFLVLCNHFLQFRRKYPKTKLQHLYFISCEKYPLQLEELQKIQATWPQLSYLSAELLAQWPLNISKCHRIFLANRTIILDLWLNDISILINEFKYRAFRFVNAWFLDGFAPAKNPEMWTAELFDTMSSTAKEDCTFATFTAAGSVRRGLAQANFIVEKRQGFAYKREMLVGKYKLDLINSSTRKMDCSAEIAVIGGGIASVLICDALVRKGAKVTLFCDMAQAAIGASGNRQAVLYPLLTTNNPLLNCFFIKAFLYAHQFYSSLSTQSIDFDHAWCGVNQLAYNDKSRQKIHKILQDNWPTTFVDYSNAEQMNQQCGIPINMEGLTYRQGGWLAPYQLIRNLFTHLVAQGLTIHWQQPIKSLVASQNGWQLVAKQGESHYFPTVILANGYQINQFSQTEKLPLRNIRGQVSYVSVNPTLQKLQQVLCYDGYLTPYNPRDGLLSLGATHIKNVTNTNLSSLEQHQNYDLLHAVFNTSTWIKEINVNKNLGNCGIRSNVRDHFPMVGEVPNYNTIKERSYAELTPDTVSHPNLFMLGGLGSRGMCTAPLLAELLASQIMQLPLPLEQEIIDALDPKRFWLRKKLKNQPI